MHYRDPAANAASFPGLHVIAGILTLCGLALATIALWPDKSDHQVPATVAVTPESSIFVAEEKEHAQSYGEYAGFLPVNVNRDTADLPSSAETETPARR